MALIPIMMWGASLKAGLQLRQMTQEEKKRAVRGALHYGRLNPLVWFDPNISNLPLCFFIMAHHTYL